jgi:hypothetical protein
MQLLSLAGPLGSIDMSFGVDEQTNIVKAHVQKRSDYVFKYS